MCDSYRQIREPVAGSGTVTLQSREDRKHDENGFSRADVTTMKHSYPLKFLVPNHASSSMCKWIFPITFGGGLVGGDSIEINLHIQERCCALLATQESTKVYKCEDELVTSQTLHGQVESGALLCVLPDPVVCYKDARYKQRQTFEMSVTGNLVFLDWLTSGRMALNEKWQFDSFHTETEVFIENLLVYRDNVHLCDLPGLSVLKSLGQFQVMGSCIILGPKLEHVCEQLLQTFGRKAQYGEAYDEETICPISRLQYSVGGAIVTGVYIRFLSTSTRKAFVLVHHITELLHAVLGGDPFLNKY